MKIPKGYFDHWNKKAWEDIHQTWLDTANKISMQHGILVGVCVEIDTDGHPRVAHRWEAARQEDIVRIFFRVLDKDFEGLISLEKALKNKAFM
jgi:hypothetical protein